jgi:prefoldin subunit 5
MRLKLILSMCAGFVGSAGLADAAPSPPVEVPPLPPELSAPAFQTYRQELEQERAAIMERFQRWKARASAFNVKYGGQEFDEDSQEAKDGAIEQAWLSREEQDYQRLANAFKAKVGKLTEIDPVDATRETPTDEPAQKDLIKVQAEITEVQRALETIEHSEGLDAASRKEWEDRSSAATRDAFVLAGHSTLDALAALTQRKIAAANAEFRRANDLLMGEGGTDAASVDRRDQLQSAIGAIGNSIEELKRAKERIDDAHDAVDIFDKLKDTVRKGDQSTQEMEYSSREEEARNAIETAWNDCDKLNMLPKGARQTKTAVDAWYDVTVQVVSVRRLNELNANSEQYLKAVRALSQRMTDLVKIKKEEQSQF